MATVSPHDKPLVWLKGQVKTPPLSNAARIEAGFLLRRLQSGDLLFQYTDGLVEAHNKAKQMYGEERLKDLLLGCADLSSEEIVDLVRDSVLKHIDGREQEDDITLIVLKVS